MAWALEMAALAWIGARTHSTGLRYAALAVFILVLFRLDGIDSWMYSSPAVFQPVMNARFLTFLIAAAASWASASLAKPGWEALCLYLGDHYIIIFTLTL